VDADLVGAAVERVAAELGRQALHAAVLEIEHPTTGARMRFEAALPDDFTRARAQLTRSST
jgi:23S rRNA pseudouridine1911/1915/1917 synthase